MKTRTLLLCILLLAACKDGDFESGVRRMTWQEKPQAPRLAAMTRYCYKASSDTLCYTNPQAGMEDRLIGYQEPLVPVYEVYDRVTLPPRHYDPTTHTVAPLKIVTVSAPPPVKGAEPIRYDADALEPHTLITSKR